MPHQHQGDAFVSGQMRIGFHGNTLSHVLHLDLETALVHIPVNTKNW
jgi:hypothetical protein